MNTVSSVDGGGPEVLAPAATVPGAASARTDRLTRLAALGARAAAATTTLVGAGSIAVVGAFGLDELAGDQQTLPDDTTLCALVIETEHPVLIEDARRDPRTVGHPGIAAHIGAYAGYPLRHPNGQVFGVCAVYDRRPRAWRPDELAALDDVADLLAGELAPRAGAQPIASSPSFVEALLDCVHTGIAACDADGRLVLFNRQMRQALTADIADLPVSDWAKYYHLHTTDGDPHPPETLPLWRALTGEPVRDHDVVCTVPGTRSRILNINAEPVRDTTGTLLGAVSVAHDVTRVRRNERLKSAELAAARLLTGPYDLDTTAVRVLQTVTVAAGGTGAQLWLPDGAARTLHCRASWHTEATQATDAADATDATDATDARDGTDAAVHGDHVLPDAVVTAWVTGQVATSLNPDEHTVAVPIRTGDCIGVIVMVLDSAAAIDEGLVWLLDGTARMLGQYLERSRADDLDRRLAQSRKDFVGLIGHELRTPLTSVAAYTDLLVECDDTTTIGEVRDMLTVVQRNTGNLCAIIADLLDLEALESGIGDEISQRIDLTAVVQDELDRVTPAAQTHGITVTSGLQPCTVTGNLDRLRQVVANLLGNAVAYNPHGHRLDVSLTATAHRVELVITDDGLGIPDHEQPLLFQRFHRGAEARERRIPGTGLGLALSRLIVQRHAGTITMTPNVPTGTVMTVVLPCSSS